MKILGLHVPFTPKQQPSQEKGTATVSNWGGDSWGASAGTNFQTGRTPSASDITRFTAVQTSINIISTDIAKLPCGVYQKLENGGFERVTTHPLSRLLITPNSYQTRFDFFSQVMISALMRGNAYIFAPTDQRGQVTGLYVLNPDNTTPLVDQTTGDVFYSVGSDPLIPLLGSRSQNEEVLGQRWNIPERFIINHRLGTFKHPLVGVSPLHSAMTSAITGLNIQGNQSEFFANMARPSGVLKTNEILDESVIARLRTQWTNLFSGSNATNFGGTAVLEQGVSWEQMTMTSTDAQMLETLKWSSQDVASAFRVPGFMLGDLNGATYKNASEQARVYLNSCLSSHIENLENRFDTKFGLEKAGLYMEFDTDQFLRTDPESRINSITKGIQGGVYTPNEGRKSEGLPKVDGGDQVFMQQQMVPIDMLGEINNPTLPSPEPSEPPIDVEELSASVRRKSAILRAVK